VVADDVTFGHTGNMRLLDALIRRKLPMSQDAPDVDGPDAVIPQFRCANSGIPSRIGLGIGLVVGLRIRLGFGLGLGVRIRIGSYIAHSK